MLRSTSHRALVLSRHLCRQVEGKIKTPLEARPMSSSTIVSSATELVQEMKKAGGLPEWTWQQTMLRVKDKEKSLRFYRDVIGLTLIDHYDFPQFEFSLYFLASLPPGTEYTLTPGSDEAHKYLWSTNSVCLELTHNWGTEKDEGFKYHPGNQEKDGFGHLAFACDDVYEACEKLEAKGVLFKKKPDEGRMKGLAFALDPDGYFMEIITRGVAKEATLPYFQLAQTMLRVKDPAKSLKFYEGLGMKLVDERHFDDFSLYFLATLPKDLTVPDPTTDAGSKFVREVLYPAGVPVLELTHNHGTEKDEGFVHYNGNTEPRKGFGHVGFLVDDIEDGCAKLESQGVKFQKKLNEGSMKGLAFALDPDGYWVEIIKRGHPGDF